MARNAPNKRISLTQTEDFGPKRKTMVILTCCVQTETVRITGELIISVNGIQLELAENKRIGNTNFEPNFTENG